VRAPLRATATLASLALSVALVSAQTVVRPPNNRYTPAQDVELGRRAAAQARQQLPMLRDAAVNGYVAALGRRLVAAVPAQLRHRGFQYSFQVVNAREINAFALPGGPMFVNRGMIEAAQSDGQVAGVMAHELSHIVLRHGTAQATRATPYEIGGGGPEWLSDHPNPGNRYEYITREARLLKVSPRPRDNGSLRAVQVRLRQIPPAPTRQVSRR
jgi:predicted Zn-dependent protease